MTLLPHVGQSVRLGLSLLIVSATLSEFAKAKPIEPRIKAPLVAVVAEGDLVVLAFAREGTDPKDATKKYTTTWFDMFRIENGKIAEHWDPATKQ